MTLPQPRGRVNSIHHCPFRRHFRKIEANSLSSCLYLAPLNTHLAVEGHANVLISEDYLSGAPKAMDVLLQIQINWDI